MSDAACEQTFAPSTWACLPKPTPAWIKPLDAKFERFLHRLKRREFADTSAVAEDTLSLLESFIEHAQGVTVRQMVALLRKVGRVLTEARPTEMVVGNIVRRVLYVLRSEAVKAARMKAAAAATPAVVPAAAPKRAAAAAAGGSVAPSPAFTSSTVPLSMPAPAFALGAPAMSAPAPPAGPGRKSVSIPAGGSGLLRPTPLTHSSSSLSHCGSGGVDVASLHGLFEGLSSVDGEGALDAPLAPLKAEVFVSTGEVRGDLDDGMIVADARKHIYANETVLTYDYSETVVRFLAKAAEERPFDVIVAETAPVLTGHKTATALAQLGIRATLVQDAAVFALMPSVSKVIVDTQAVMADGGLLATAGAASIALAAKHHSVPVVVLAGLHKLSPLYAFDADTFQEHRPPAQLLAFDEALEGRVDVIAAGYDYVPPSHVGLFISHPDDNQASYQPSYVYRLLAEFYHVDDYALE